MNNRKKITLIAVLVMLCLAAGAWLLLFDRQTRPVNQGVGQGTEIGEGAVEVIKETEETISASFIELISDWTIADRVYSHRGSAGENEHSFEAYDEAIEAGSHNIEQDIVVSGEGTLFVSHDLNAYNLTGIDKPFSDMTDSEIDGLNRHSGGKVLRLSEVFDRYGKKVHYIVELKSGDDAAVDGLCKLIDEYGYENLVVAQSFEEDVLGRIETVYPDMPKIFLCKTQAAVDRGPSIDSADIVSVRTNFANEATAESIRKAGKKFSVWTPDSENEIRNAIELGADAYFTNDTALALDLEKKYRPVSFDKSADGGDHSTLLFVSDYQAMDGFDAPSETLRKVTRAAVADGKEINMAVICGDYTNDATLHDYQLSGEESIGEIKDILAEEAAIAGDDKMLFVQGNHDAMSESIAASGLHEYDNYLVYVLNTENDFPWKQGKSSGCYEKVKKAADDMRECFDKLIASGETRPLIIAGHVPIHFTARTSSKHTTGDNLYSSLVFDAVNEAAESLDVIYLFGHNHSKGWDCYLGGSCVYRRPGDEIIIPEYTGGEQNTNDFRTETLNFTYMNAGYVGYYMNCAPSEYSSDEDSEYRAADETLTCSVLEIYEDEIVITRYDENGRHLLGAAGAANPYKGGIDADLISSKNYSRECPDSDEIYRKQSGGQSNPYSDTQSSATDLISSPDSIRSKSDTILGESPRVTCLPWVMSSSESLKYAS